MTAKPRKPSRADTEPAPRQFQFPHRDASGRAVSLLELTAVALIAVAVTLVAVVVVDGVTALLGLAEFGGASGWLALILPGLLFFDDIKAWTGYGVRFLVALVGAAIAISLGLVVAAWVSSLPPIISGAVGAAVAVLVYSPIWFLGVRWLTGDSHGEAA